MVIMKIEEFVGIICYHKINQSFMFIKKAEVFNEELNFACKVFIKEENGDSYYADATYGADEVLLTNKKIQQLIAEKKQREGTQLSFF